MKKLPKRLPRLIRAAETVHFLCDRPVRLVPSCLTGCPSPDMHCCGPICTTRIGHDSLACWLLAETILKIDDWFNASLHTRSEKYAQVLGAQSLSSAMVNWPTCELTTMCDIRRRQLCLSESWLGGNNTGVPTQSNLAVTLLLLTTAWSTWVL